MLPQENRQVLQFCPGAMWRSSEQLRRSQEQFPLSVLLALYNSQGEDPNIDIFTEDFPDSFITREGSLIDDDKNNAQLFQDLQNKLEQLQSRIGRRYKTRAQRGFLNVHSDTSNPFATQNIIGQLVEGEVVTSIAPNEGKWIKHDAFGGGWSISNYGGWQWLIPLDD